MSAETPRQRTTRAPLPVCIGATGVTSTLIYVALTRLTSLSFGDALLAAFLVGLLTAAGSVIGSVRYLRRRRTAADLAADLTRRGDIWVLAKSGMLWEHQGVPGPLRLARGGLGKEATGRELPVEF